nr:MAG TPA: hypothetical protein [Caudoviricetes sp.]
MNSDRIPFTSFYIRAKLLTIKRTSTVSLYCNFVFRQP